MRTRIAVVLAASFAAAALTFAACSDRGRSPTPTEVDPTLAKGGGGPKVRSISVAPSTATVDIGATVQLTAKANPTSSATTFAWSSSNAAVAAVDQSGRVTGVAAGSATITAAAGGKNGSASITVSATPSPPGGEVLVGAGDIANCSVSGDEATAKLLDVITGTVFVLGDNAYPSGTLANYTDCYGPTWGRHKARTMPTPGNHEYQTANAAGYFGYFGSAAGDPAKGYYSYNLGDWHIIVLNSGTCSGSISCAAGSAQEQWLRADLAANAKACTLAYWHHPRFNSGGAHGNDTAVAPFWSALYQSGAEVVVNGHEHVYERFAPQTPNAVADPAFGIRQFTVGTGGSSHYTFGTIKANSERRDNTSFGVLKLTLRSGGYDWQFIPVAGASFTDSGSGTCHAAPSP